MHDHSAPYTPALLTLTSGQTSQPNAKLDMFTDMQLLRECFTACDFDGDGGISQDEWDKITHFHDHLGQVREEGGMRPQTVTVTAPPPTTRHSQAKGKGVFKNCFPMPHGRDMDVDSFIELGRPILNQNNNKAKVLRNAIKDLLEAKQAFIACDADGSGEVDAGEMMKVMALIGVKDATEQVSCARGLAVSPKSRPEWTQGQRKRGAPCQPKTKI